MKRIFVFVLMGLILMSIFLVSNVFAQSYREKNSIKERAVRTSPENSEPDDTENYEQDRQEAIQTERKILERENRIETRMKERIENKDEEIKIRKEFRERIKQNDGEIEIEGEKRIKIREVDEDGERKEIIAGRINARTGLNLTAEDIENTTRLRAILSNGRFADIKVMPDRASAIALAKLRAKCLERNCTVELKEITVGNKTIAAYELNAEKESTILFFFKRKMRVAAKVDAETGEIILIKKPWWAFFAKEKDEEDSDIDNDNEAGENETENDVEKVILCHIPPGNPGAAKTIRVGTSAVRAHLAHGDYLGVCIREGGNQTDGGNQTVPGNESTGNNTINNSG